MHYNKLTRKYFAHVPTDLLGWEVKVLDFIEPDNDHPYPRLLVSAIKKDTKESRLVTADVLAVPMASFEKLTK